MTVVIKIDTAKLEALAARLDTDMGGVVRSITFQVVGRAIKRAPVDTGALKNSITATQQGPLTWWAHDSVEYGIYQELGTSRMAAQPFMVPAVLETERDVARLVGEAIEK